MAKIPLEELAENFHNATHSGVEGVRSNEEMLKEIFDLPNFEDRVEKASKNKDWKKLGEGSSRTIFQISDSLILKIAHNEAGIAQNEAEMAMHSPCLNNILAADSDARWVITRFSETMEKKDFEEYTGFPMDTFMRSLLDTFNNEHHEPLPKEHEEIKQLPLFRELVKLVLKHQLQLGDCRKTSSWGMLDGRPVLRDFGLTKEVYKDHYKSDSSTTSKSHAKGNLSKSNSSSSST